MRVKVYWNVRGRTFSVVDLATGRVCGRTTSDLMLKDCKLTVGAKGRERVRKERRKNVHAFIYGTLVTPNPPDGEWRGVGYNPYKNEHWEDARGMHVRKAEHVYMYVTECGKPVVQYDATNYEAD